MAFPPAFLDELAARNPIEDVVGQYVSLTRRGSNLFGLCPFHSEKTPSFSVAPDKGIYYCFGCHKGGGPINFIMEVEGLDYPDAVRFLAKRAGMEVPEDREHSSVYRKQERLRALCKEAARFYRQELFAPGGKEARDYLIRRGVSSQTVSRFGLGYSPNAWSALLDTMEKMGYTKEELRDAGLALQSKKGGYYDRFRNRLMFPIIDVRGNVIGFGGRVMDDSTPKYLNSPETIIFNKRKNLFALNVAKKSTRGQLILTEGYMDAIALHQYGFDCAVASLGTALTQEHTQLLAKYTKAVVLTYDGDEAGQNATRRAIPMLEQAGLQVKILRMQGAKDPDEFLHKFGADKFQALLQKSENQAEYRLQTLKNRYDLQDDAQRVSFLKEAAELISTFTTPVEREVYGTRAAEAAGISQAAMEQEIKRAYRRRTAQAKKRQARADLDVAGQQQPREKGIRYTNLKSAMAEEQLLAQVLKEPTLLPTVKLLPEQFSSPLLGRAFGLLRQCQLEGRPVSLPSLEGDFTPEEMNHLSSVVRRRDTLVSEQAMADCADVIRNEYERTVRTGDDALRAMQQKLRTKKGYGG